MSGPAERATSATSDAGQAHTLDLVRRAQSGDLAAFNSLVLGHQDQAYSLALRFMGSRQAAEDATQESFLRAYRAIGRFRGQRFRSWLLTIVANTCRDELRSRRRRPQQSLDRAREVDGEELQSLDPADPGPGPEAAAERSELRAALERALLQLPEEWRLVVILSDVHGLSYDEVAEVTSLPLGTVKSRLSRARGRLRDVLLATGELAGGLERHRG